MRRRPSSIATVRLGLMVAIAAVLAVVLAVTGVRLIAESRLGTADAGPQLPVTYVPPTDAAFIALVDDGGSAGGSAGGAGRAAGGFVVIALRPDRSGGTLVPVPNRLAVTLPGVAEPQPLATAFAAGGIELARESVEAVLGVRFTDALELERRTLAGLLAPWAPLTVTLVDPVGDFDRGTQRIDAEGIATLLTTSGRGETEAMRTPRTEALWQALVASRDAADTVEAPALITVPTSMPETPVGDAAAYWAAAFGGPLEVVTLPGDPVGALVDDLVDFDPAPARLLAATVMPSLVSPAGDGARIHLVNPYPEASVALAVTRRLLVAGFELVLVSGSEGEPPATTEVAYIIDADRPAAEALTDALGGGRTRPDAGRIEGVDLTVTLGPEALDLAEDDDSATSGGN
jgi:hypothetical protein